MGSYLLDTHTAIWFFNGDSALSMEAKQVILNNTNRKYVSMVSAWEIAIKISLGKLDFNGRSAGFVSLAENNGFIIIPIETEHLTVLESLPLIHSDPFDRLLTATAIAEQMTLITADKNIHKYTVPHIW